MEFRSPVPLHVAVAALGGFSTLLILYRILHHPSGGQSGTIGGVHYGFSYGIKIGIWLALISAAALTYGAYLAMQDEGTSIADVRDQATGALSGLASSRAGHPPPEGSSPAGGAAPAPGASASHGGGAPPIPPPASPADGEPPVAGAPPADASRPPAERSAPG